MALTKRHLLAGAAALAISATLPAAAPAQFASPIRAVFLKEYSRQNYVINQGEILAFENDDPFLFHGVAGPGFSAPVIPPGSTSLVRRALYLVPGTYPIADPKNPSMTSSLTVTSSGTPAPPDSTPPATRVRIASGGGAVSNRGKVKVRVAPSETADISLTARIGKLVLGSATKAFLLPARGSVTIAVPPHIRKRIPPRFRLSVRGTITDAAGNFRKLRASKSLGGRRR